ncbi:MAG: hypothetical protein H6R05_803 [Burkholderiaceae bacterium]|nr:hypothetical protein [Burkholderiaceae bacterium]
MSSFKKILLLLGFLFFIVFVYFGYQFLKLKEVEVGGQSISTASVAASAAEDECRDSVSGKMYDYFVGTNSANIRANAGTNHSIVTVLSQNDLVLKLDEKTVMPDLTHPITRKDVLFTTASATFTLPANMMVQVVDVESDASTMVRIRYEHPELGILEARVPKDVLDLTEEPKLWFKIRTRTGEEGWVSRRLLSTLDAC